MVVLSFRIVTYHFIFSGLAGGSLIQCHDIIISLHCFRLDFNGFYTERLEAVTAQRQLLACAPTTDFNSAGNFADID